MQILLSPQYRDDAAQMTLARTGDLLVINTIAYDPAAPAACPWFAAPPVPTDTGWRISLLFPVGPRAPHEALFPQPITLSEDGPAPLPPCNLPDEDEAPIL